MLKVVHVSDVPRWSFICDPNCFEFHYDPETELLLIRDRMGAACDIEPKSGNIFLRQICTLITDVFEMKNYSFRAPLILNPNHTVTLMFRDKIQVSYY